MAGANVLSGEPRPVPVAGGPGMPTAYDYYVIVLLMLAYMVSFLDRVLISLLIEPIRAEFHLGDTDIGLLVGFGFVLFYSLLGVPFGALADRSNRRNLIVGGLVGWSLATAASAFAGSYRGLLMARTAVGVGEASLSPAAVSTISDRFPPARRGFALGLYSSGVSLGGGLALAFGGVLVAWTSRFTLTFPLIGMLGGWRLAMFLVGLVGFPLAVVMLLTMREAPRFQSAASADFAALLRHIGRHRGAFVAVFAGYSCAVLASYIPLLWAPSLLIRVHRIAVQDVGAVLGAIVGIGGLVGVLAGGIISDLLSRRGVVDAPVRVILWSAVVQLPLLAGAFVASSTTLTLWLLAAGQFFISLFGGLQAATLQLLTPSRMRGRMMALYLLVVTLVGMGLGPLFIGLLSDHVFEGRQAFGYALAVVSSTGLALCIAILAASAGRIRRAILIQLGSESV